MRFLVALLLWVGGWGCTPLERSSSVVGTEAAVDEGATVEGCEPPFCEWAENLQTRCASARAPSALIRPEEDDSGGEEAPVEAIHLGLQQLSLSGGQSGGGDAEPSGWGFDLDGQCTGLSGCEFTQACGATHPFVLPDLPYCADNTFARLIADVTAGADGHQLALSDGMVNCALARGSYNHILRITDYNGRAQDAQVRVDFYGSGGLEQGAASGDCVDGDTEEPTVAWSETSRWRIFEQNFISPMGTGEGLPNSKVSDSSAFVRDGYLVATVPAAYELTLTAAAGDAASLRFALHRAVIVGRLEEADGVYRLTHGAIAGLQAAQDVLQGFAQLGVCAEGEHAELHAALSQYLRDYADMPLDEDVSADSPCDSVSTAFRFEATAITPGDPEVGPELLNCCRPENSGRAGCPAPLCGNGEVDAAEACDVAIAPGAEGACPTECPKREDCVPLLLSGSGCDTRCVEEPITTPKPGDGCCPDGATAANDDDCPGTCGDGAVQVGETCDSPGSCQDAASCEASAVVCTVANYSGEPSRCDARCEIEPIRACENGDGCCPLECDPMSDSDCSASCGNDMVEEPLETCDGNCPQNCEPSEVCKRAELVGSAAQCSAQCVEHDITTCINDDGCCPPSCQGATDNDCETECGNGILEGREACDDGNDEGGDGCVDCRIETPAQLCTALTSDIDSVSMRCLACNCERCAEDFNRCFNTGTEEEKQLCRDVAVCRLRTWCQGLDCYIPYGPCAAEVEAAGMSMNLFTLISNAENLDHVFGRASPVEICSRSRCDEECSPF